MDNLDVTSLFEVSKEPPCKLIMSDDDYHDHPAIGSSGIKTILRSVAHYEWDKKNRHTTKAMNFGRALHCAVLEPKRFQTDVISFPEFSGTGMREKKEKWMIMNHGKIMVTADEMADIMAMLKSISRHRLASGLLTGGQSEASYFWVDKTTGIVCKCRPDYRRSGGVVLDIKSTTDASFPEFERSILNYGYHLSAAHYLDGVSQVMGEKFEKFLIIAVEKEAPYGVQVFEIDFGALEKGLELRDRGLLKLKNSREQQIVPTYSDEIVSVSIPAYGFSA